MNNGLLQGGVFKSDNFTVSFERKSASCVIERNDNNQTDFLKVYSDKELEELRDVLWELSYGKLLIPRLEAKNG